MLNPNARGKASVASLRRDELVLLISWKLPKHFSGGLAECTAEARDGLICVRDVNGDDRARPVRGHLRID